MDPYGTLGVNKSASADDIKKAYRKMAHKYHPDKKGGDEAKFKEVNEAYQILSDPDKKARYDQFGSAGMNGGFQGGYGGGEDYQDFNFNMGDIFNMFSGGFGGGAQAQRPEKGEDLQLRVGISNGDLGKRKVYEFDAFKACGTCDTTGVEPGAKMNTCATCHGQGQVRQAVRTPFGTFAQTGICPKCQGEGRVPEKTCRTCGGTGREKTKRTIEVRIPKELPSEYLVVVPRGGNIGQRGTPAGDLTVTIRKK